MSLKVHGAKDHRTYFDHNATTPVAEEVANYVVSHMSDWGNPSSIHWAGRGPKAILRESRRELSKGLGAQDLELVFTSGGSESNNMALMGIYEYVMAHQEISSAGPKTFRMIISAVEHPSVMQTAEHLRTKGAEVEVIPVNRQGELDLEIYQRALEKPTDIVSIMTANNETGAIFPIKHLCTMAHNKGCFFHTDAVQALGKIEIDLKEWGVDYASFSAHKFYSLKGSGFLYCRKGAPQWPLIHGGRQERSRRAGTENVLAIGALGEMAKKLAKVKQQSVKVKELRDLMESEIIKNIDHVRINGTTNHRLVNTSSLLIEDIDGESLLMALDVKGFAVSTGAACSSGSQEPSPVLLAMGLTRFEAQSSLRVSLGWENTKDEVLSFVTILSETVARLRKIRLEERAQ